MTIMYNAGGADHSRRHKLRHRWRRNYHDRHDRHGGGGGGGGSGPRLPSLRRAVMPAVAVLLVATLAFLN